VVFGVPPELDDCPDVSVFQKLLLVTPPLCPSPMSPPAPKPLLTAPTL